MKLSDLCRKHITRTVDEDWCWVDSVVIQRDDDGYQTLVYFKSTKKVTFSEDEKKEGYEDDVYEVIQVVWFNKKGKITMIDGRFSVSFYEKNKDVILELIFKNELVELDYEECSKIENVYFNHEQKKESK